LVEQRQFARGLSDAQRPRDAATGAAGFLGRGLLLGAPFRLVEIRPGMILAEVQFADFSRLQFGDVEHGLFVALLALHAELPPGTGES